MSDDDNTFHCTTTEAFHYTAGGPIQGEAELWVVRHPDGEVLFRVEWVGGGEMLHSTLNAIEANETGQYLDDNIDDAGAGSISPGLAQIRSELTFRITNDPYTADFTQDLDNIREFLLS